MASVASSGTSPLPSYDPTLSGDDESWAFIDPSNASDSIGFFPSPATGSLASWGVVGTGQMQMQPSPGAPPSPLYLDMEAAAGYAMQFQDQTTSLNVSGTSEAGFLSSAGGVESSQFMTPQDLIFGDQQLQDLSFLNSFTSNVPRTGLETFDAQLQSPQLEIPAHLQTTTPDVAPWGPTNLKQSEDTMFIMEEFRVSPPPHTRGSNLSPSLSPPTSASPQPSPIKLESGPGSHKTPSPIRKVKGNRVEKKKSPGSDGSAGSASKAGQFVIVTPNSINAHEGNTNPFECFEAMRTTQKGRKGPLANEIKENALQVRRLGACFCCHARKVKCDAERPCKNCKKMAVAVPQVVCWQFQDFLTVLFPDFIRQHLKKDEMSKFLAENIEGFKISGVEKPCSVELSSGLRFATTLTIRAKFFTPKTTDVLSHWHLNKGGNGVTLQAKGTAPIGLELDGNPQKQRDELRRKAKEYIHSITQEPAYADQVTDALHHTELPRKVLQIVQRYNQRADSAMVKKALSIYAMHYVMTRHLCLTRQSIVSLRDSKLVAQDEPWVTPRVLNRQIKAVLDELLMRETSLLFEAFSKSLKPKLRREWAPCTAAFLVLCLFMESVETAADDFVVSQNEINMRNKYLPQYDRHFALNLNQEVENMPFKQFAYQFHNIYQTHVKDATTKAFNPLVDNEAGELDAAGVELVMGLRDLISGDSCWELDALTVDPILGNIEGHPFPRDVGYNYTGRLTAKFLLSFLDEKYIFEPEI